MSMKSIIRGAVVGVSVAVLATSAVLAGEAQPAPAPTRWETSAKVEVKWGGTYREATIVNRRDEWYLIQYAPGRTREWVEPWRIRKVGSKEDDVGYAKPNTPVRNNEGPPKEKPDPAPEPLGGGAGRPRPDRGDRPGRPGRPGAAAEKPDDAFTKDPAYKDADAAGERVLDLKGAPGGAVVPDVSQQKPVAERPVALKGMTDARFGEAKHVAFAQGKPVALVAHGGTGNDGKVALERVDLAAGTSAAVYDVGEGIEFLDASPDGTHALFRSAGFGAGKQNYLILFKLDGDKAQRTLVFAPYGHDWTRNKIELARFVDADHVLTFNGRDRVVLWNLGGAGGAKAVWACEADWHSKPALSATGRYVAISAKGRAVVLEALTGKVASDLELPTSGGAALAFGPSGKQLAAYAGSTLTAWDLTSGQVISEFSMPRGIGGRTLSMTADNYALLGDKHLLDLERRVVLWTYNLTRGAGTVAPSGQLGYVVRDPFKKAATFHAITLPHADAVATAKLINPEQVMLLMPGAKVGLSVNVNEDAAGVTEALKNRIAQSGLVYDENAPVKFVATIEPGKSEEREYRPFGRGPFGPTEKVTVTSTVSRLSLQVDGNAAWESTSTAGAGGFITLKEGQSIQDAVNEAAKPNVAFFRNARLPRYVAKPRDPVAYGTSYLTPNGIRHTDK